MQRAPNDPYSLVVSKPGRLQQTTFALATDKLVLRRMGSFCSAYPTIALFQRRGIWVVRFFLIAPDKSLRSQRKETGRRFHPRPFPEKSKAVAKAGLRNAPDRWSHKSTPTRLG